MSTSTMRAGPIAIGVVAGIALALFGSASSASADPGDNDFLGTAESFVIIASDTVTDAGLATVVRGDVALTSTPAAMQLDDATQVLNGDIFVDAPTPDPTAMLARDHLGTAYGQIAGASPTEVVGTANLALAIAHSVNGEFVYYPGTYNSASFLLVDGQIVLDGLNDPNAVFIFQAGSELSVASSAQILLRNGAQACNVYWQVGSSATIGTSAQFVGTILAATSISAQTGAVIDGQLLASAVNAGAVTLDHNTIHGQTRCVRSTTSDDGTTTTTDREDGVTTTTVTPPVGTGPGSGPGSGAPGDGTPGGLAATGVDFPILPMGGAALAVLALGGLLLMVRGGTVRQ